MQHEISRNQIWQVLDSRAYGGIESHIYYLSSALKKVGRNTCVIFINDYGPHPLEKLLAEQDIHYIKCEGSKDYIQLVRAFSPWIIHAHGYKASLASKLAGKLCNIPTITSFHAGDAETLRLKMYTGLDRATSFLNPCIAVNSNIAKSLPVQSQVIDNFVPVPNMQKTITHLEHIGFVGRLSHEKGPDRFINLAKNFPSLTFHFFGQGPMRGELEARAPKNVRFHGHILDMTSIWNTIDLLCMPSRKEGLPLAALEAMAFGVPVLAAPVGGLPELIEHQKNGWIRPFSNMEDIIRTLNPSDLQIFGQRAKEKIIKSYSAEMLVPKFISLYEQTALRNRSNATYKGHTYATP